MPGQVANNSRNIVWILAYSDVGAVLYSTVNPNKGHFARCLPRKNVLFGKVLVKCDLGGQYSVFKRFGIHDPAENVPENVWVIAIVESSLELLKIVIHVLGAHLVEYIDEGTLEQTPYAFHAVGVNVAHGLHFLVVVYCLVERVVVSDADIGFEFVRVGSLGLVPRQNSTSGKARLGRISKMGRRDIRRLLSIEAMEVVCWADRRDAGEVGSIAQTPTARLLARTKAATGRKPKDANAIWRKAGRILLAERLRTNTHRVLGIGFEEEVLGNTWWALKTQELTKEQEKALLLYLNCSLAIALYYGRRVITEGAFMQMKKPAWASMPVLNVRVLNRRQLETLGAVYDNIAKEKLAPLAQLNTDDVRIRIDAEISNALGLGNLKPIRELLAREPGLSGEEING